jgi:cytosine/adenosine deaminase-related metal-dependent hydrolase
MRKISADYIFPVSSEPIANGVILLDDNGVILEVKSAETITNNEDIEFYKGIICPGFINTHCHLELSHMRSQIPENTGMTGFVKEIISKRNLFSEDEIQHAIADAEAEMIRNGIVAVGDISNNNNSFKQKSKQNLYYHTFIEVFDLNPERAIEVFENALSLSKELSTFNFQLSNSITPHAPYSVSDKLFKLVYDNALKNNSTLSIHNQESESENELFISKTGAMFQAFSQMGINMDIIKQTGVSSLQSTFLKLPASQKKLLVHNTFTSKADIEFVTQNAKPDIAFWCTCPNANIYIEGKLPNYQLFIDANAHLTIGTDSLASNWSLSVLDELKTIAKANTEISLQNLLLWATKNGAAFLGLKDLGTLEIGKKPGINLLENIEGLKITEKTSVKRLL